MGSEVTRNSWVVAHFFLTDPVNEGKMICVEEFADSISPNPIVHVIDDKLISNITLLSNTLDLSKKIFST